MSSADQTTRQALEACARQIIVISSVAIAPVTAWNGLWLKEFAEDVLAALAAPAPADTLTEALRLLDAFNRYAQHDKEYPGSPFEEEVSTFLASLREPAGKDGE